MLVVADYNLLSCLADGFRIQFRLGILVDLLSRSTITGYMAGTAAIIMLQQLKGLLGMSHFTQHTDVVSVLRAVVAYRSDVSSAKKKKKSLSSFVTFTDNSLVDISSL